MVMSFSQGLMISEAWIWTEAALLQSPNSALKHLAVLYSEEGSLGRCGRYYSFYIFVCVCTHIYVYIYLIISFIKKF